MFGVSCCLWWVAVSAIVVLRSFYDEYGGASSDVVLKYTGESVERMACFCGLLLRECSRMVKRARLFRGSYFCADYTDVIYSGRSGEYMLNVLETGKARMKLRRAFRYGVSCVVRPGARYFLGIRPARRVTGCEIL
jgi:hypothetical protein